MVILKKTPGQYWSNLKEKLRRQKESYHQHVELGKLFTSMASTGSKFFIDHNKNMNHGHKDSKSLVSVIITMGNNIRGGYIVFYAGVKTFVLGSRAHVFKQLPWKNDIWSIWKKIHEGNLWRVHRAVISFILTRQISLHFCFNGETFYNLYINKTDKKRYLDDDDTGVEPKNFLQRGIRSKPGYDPMQQFWDIDRKITRDNFGKKRNSTGFIYITG